MSSTGSAASESRPFRGVPNRVADALLELLTPERRWYQRIRSRSLVIAIWIISRGLLLAALVLLPLEQRIAADVRYYARTILQAGDAGIVATMKEYPVPAVWILSIPHAISSGSAAAYFIGFIALMVALDAIFTFVLWRSGGRQHTAALDFWLLFVLLLGPLTFVRFDIIPCVLAAGALLAARSRPRLAGALVGAGAAIKLWPALLQPALSALRSTRSRTTMGFAVAGGGLALLSLVTTHFDRLLSPLVWQAKRGLQIESVPATPLMIARMLQPERWTAAQSPYQAIELSGEAVSSLVHLSTVATLLGILGIGVMAARAFRNAGISPSAVAMFFLAVVLIMISTNKTLSPQYITWLGGPMAVLLLLRPQLRPVDQQDVNRMALQLLGIAMMTHVLYPYLYDRLLGAYGPRQIIPATAVLSLRNFALILMTADACRLTWRWSAVSTD